MLRLLLELLRFLSQLPSRFIQLHFPRSSPTSRAWGTTYTVHSKLGFGLEELGFAGTGVVVAFAPQKTSIILHRYVRREQFQRSVQTNRPRTAVSSPDQ